MRGDLGRGAVGEAGRLERAASLVEGVADPLGRQRAAGRRAGRAVDRLERRTGLGRQLEGIALGAVDDRAEQLAAPGGVRRDQRRATLAREDTRPSVGSAAAASPSSKASTTARSPIPKGARRSRMSSAARRPERVAASTSPESRRSVSLATRSRISSSATTIAACCTQSRSKSPSSPERRTTTSQASADAGAAARPDGRAPGRADPVWLGTNGAAAVPRGCTSSRIASTQVLGELAAAVGQHLAAGVEHHRAAADRRGDLARDLVEAAALQDEPLEALVDRDPAGEHVVLLVDQPAEGRLGDRDERGLVRNLEDREVGRLRPR